MGARREAADMIAFLGGLPRRLATTVDPTAFVCGGNGCLTDFFILAVAALASKLDSAERFSSAAPRVLFFDSVRINVALDCSELTTANSLRLVVDEAGVSE